MQSPPSFTPINGHHNGSQQQQQAEPRSSSQLAEDRVARHEQALITGVAQVTPKMSGESDRVSQLSGDAAGPGMRNHAHDRTVARLVPDNNDSADTTQEGSLFAAPLLHVVKQDEDVGGSSNVGERDVRELFPTDSSGSAATPHNRAVKTEEDGANGSALNDDNDDDDNNNNEQHDERHDADEIVVVDGDDDDDQVVAEGVQNDVAGAAVAQGNDANDDDADDDKPLVAGNALVALGVLMGQNNQAVAQDEKKKNAAQAKVVSQIRSTFQLGVGGNKSLCRVSVLAAADADYANVSADGTGPGAGYEPLRIVTAGAWTGKEVRVFIKGSFYAATMLAVESDGGRSFALVQSMGNNKFPAGVGRHKIAFKNCAFEITSNGASMVWMKP